MYCSCQTIMSVLSGFHPSYLGGDIQKVIYTVGFCDYSTNQEMVEPTLVVAKGNFPDVKGSSLAKILVLIPDSPHVHIECSLDGSGPEAIILSFESDMDLVLNVLEGFYYKKEIHERALSEKLMSTAVGSGSIGALLKSATALLGNPFILYDVNYALVAHSVPSSLTIPAAQNVVSNGYANVEIITQMKREGKLDYVFSSREHPVLVEIPNGYQKLAIGIFDNGEYVGLLCYFNYIHEIREDDWNAVRMTAKLVSLLIHSNSNESGSWTPWSYIFSTLLQSKKRLSKVQLDNLSISIPKTLRLAVIGPRNQSQALPNTQLKYIQQEVTKWLPKAHLYFHGGTLLVLDTPDVLSSVSGRLEDHLKGPFEKTQLAMGLSNSFTEIEDLPTAFKQGRAALQLGCLMQGDGIIFEYRDISFVHLLTSLEITTDLSVFYHPAIKILAEYDREYNSDYLNFLMKYLELSCNTRDCAEYFGIHYNTVSYRLKVIQELCSVDFKNPKDLFDLNVSYNIWRVLNLPSL